MGETFKISPAVLSWIPEAVNLAELPEQQQKEYRHWVSGEKEPTYNQIMEFSDKARIPFGYFFMSTPPEETVRSMDYRTLQSKETGSHSKDLLDTSYQMVEIQDWMTEYLESMMHRHCLLSACFHCGVTCKNL